MPPQDDAKTASAMKYYEERAAALLNAYEQVVFEDVHRDLLDLLPSSPGFALDIGAGSGRDAAWLARKGWRVVAVEPSPTLRAGARRLHQEQGIQWLDDTLPRLERVRALRVQFDLVLLSAVWMHVPDSDEPRAFETLMDLLAKDGLLSVTVRMGGDAIERGFFQSDAAALKRRGTDAGLWVESDTMNEDVLGRSQVQWRRLIFRRP